MQTYINGKALSAAVIAEIKTRQVDIENNQCIVTDHSSADSF